MKPPPGQPLFLARQSYRRRRLMDAARLLPVLGVFLFALLVLRGGDGGRTTAGDGIYLIVAWAGLIVAAFVISRALTRTAATPPPDAPPQDAPPKDTAPQDMARQDPEE